MEKAQYFAEGKKDASPGGGASPTGSPRDSNSKTHQTEDDPNRIWEDLPKHLRIKKRTAYIRRHSDLKVSSKYRKFMLLMWKNFIVTKRRWKTSLLQFLAPTFFVTVLVIYISRNQKPGYDDQIYPYFTVDELDETSPHKAFQHCDTIYVLPNNSATQNFIEHLEAVLNDRFQYAVLPQASTEITPSDLCALIQFNEEMWHNDFPNDTFPETISYEIRFPAVHDTYQSRASLISIGERWDTAFREPTYMVDGAREIDKATGGHPGYYDHGFLYLQHKVAEKLIEIVVSQEILELYNGDPAKDALFHKKLSTLMDKFFVRLRRFPFPAHESEDAVQTIYNTLPTILVLGFGTSCVIMAFLSVREKEMGIRHLLKLYGIDTRYHKYTWILHNLMFQSVSVLIMAIILSTNWTNTSQSEALLADEFLGEIFFFLVVCYIFNLICGVTLLVCFFSRATTACISVCFITVVSYIPYIYVKKFFPIYSFWQKLMVCLPSNTAVGIGCLLLAEMQAEGNAQLSWSDVFSNFGEFSVGWVMIVMVTTGILELLLSQYISRVIPETGLHKLPWNFMCKSWFWNDQPPPDEVPADRSQEKSFEELHPEYFEDDSTTKQRKELCIENISKYYDQHRGLHKVNLVCYQGHITVLLGDQGSGKSSLLKMMNGSEAASSGSIYLSRKDLYKNPVLSRAFVGYCSSDDLLFPDLTVDETLQFFTDLKGVSNRIEAYEEVERFLRITSLLDFRDTRVCELTRSSQRMLMVATAFCGGSRVVLLDDPTLNLSASQQRVLWDFAAQEKKHRTILVAMDLCHEVDSVVDKIVLLHYGQITAKGSPEFLKDKFGGGYHLEIETMKNCDQGELHDLIRRRIEGSHLAKAKGRMLDFYLPQSQTPTFPGVLEELENMSEQYGVADFKVKFVTLEELHLRLKRLSTSLEETPFASRDAESSIYHRRRSKKKKASDFRLTKKQIIAPKFTCFILFRELKLMFMKNMKYSFRHRLLFLTATLFPLIVLTITTLLSQKLQLTLDTSSHHLNYTHYKDPVILVDMFKSTNEGVYMRDSVRFLLSKQNDIQRKNVEHEDDVISTILRDYNRAENENDVSDLGIEILPVKLNRSDPKSPVKVGLTGYFNNQPLHTPAVALALVDNILMDHVGRYLERDLNHVTETYKRKNYYLNVSNHPLPYQPADQVKYSEILIGPGYLYGMYCSFCYAFLISSYIIMHVKEQEFRHMQLVFGANKIIFWASNYLWNMLHFSVVAISHVVILAFMGVPGYPGSFVDRLHILGTIFIFLEMYGLTGICIVGSCATFTFKSWGRGFSKLVLFFIISGPLLMMMLIPLQNEYKGIAREGFTALHNIFLILPSYSFGSGIYCIVANEVHHRECKKYDKYVQKKCEPRTVNPFNEFDHDGLVRESCCYNKRMAFEFVAYGVGRNVFCMVLVTVFCIAQKVFSHSKKMRMLMKKTLDKKSKHWRPLTLNEHEIKDYDVLAETAKIYRGDDEHDLTIKNLTLETPVYVKLDNICLEVKKGECFAFLGALGSGKSTFLKTLYGYHYLPTFGDVEFHGLSLIKDYDEYIKAFSYSPDHNPFLCELTGEEILQIIGTLRRVPQESLDQYIAKVSDNFGMTTEMEQLIKGYSFVLVKKLCIAAALLGKFEVLLLDNPTHHLDPKSRQFILTSVRHLMENGCIVIWASHGIEHCESICSKMSVLVNGHLKCIGSLDHLRDLYEEGFTIIVRFVLDKDMIYFTSKKSIRLENELRESPVDEESGLPVDSDRQEERRRKLSETFQEDVEQALSELAPWEQDLCPFVAYFERCFPDSILVDKQPGFVHYHVHSGKATWSELFRKMEEAKVVAEVDSYYITSTNLDQVFFNFTRGQVTFDLEERY